MSTSKRKAFKELLQSHENAVKEDDNLYVDAIRSCSPSLNFTFGNGWALPRGYSIALWGPPKGGKSVISNMMIGQFHTDYPDGYAIKYNTEYREKGQLTQSQKKMWGIDSERYQAFETNTPEGVFDHIEKDLVSYIQKGMDIGLVVIDSTNQIQGRRSMAAKSVNVQQIGDHALTIKEGLKRILPIQRKYRFALILTCHVGAEMDTIEQMRGNKTRMVAAYALQHHAEYFMYVEKNRNKDGKTDLLGRDYRNEALKDIDDNSEQTGHRIRVIMKDSSMGPKGRVGEFTLDYQRGVINQYEEVFLLAKNRGVLERPNQQMWKWGDRTWRGEEAMVKAFMEDPALVQEVLKELITRDLAGAYTDADRAAAAEVAKTFGEASTEEE